MSEQQSAPVGIADGAVSIEASSLRGETWYLVSIGRSRYVKRFNLSTSEARELLDRLTEKLERG
jgi:ATP-dependent protease HslVU (ClpYQ) peptidase subunit